MIPTAKQVVFVLVTFFASTPIALAQNGWVELYANVSPADTVDFVLIDSAGKKGTTPFSIPAGGLLVVTDALITPNAVDGLYGGNVDNAGGDENRLRFRLDSTQQAMLHLPFSTGLVFTTSPKAFGFATNPGAFVVRLLGYFECTTAECSSNQLPLPPIQPPIFSR